MKLRLWVWYIVGFILFITSFFDLRQTKFGYESDLLYFSVLLLIITNILHHLSSISDKLDLIKERKLK